MIWTVIRIGPDGCDSMEFHQSGLLRFKQKADMGVIHPLQKSTVGGRKDQDLVITGNNNPVSFHNTRTPTHTHTHIHTRFKNLASPKMEQLMFALGAPVFQTKVLKHTSRFLIQDCVKKAKREPRLILAPFTDCLYIWIAVDRDRHKIFNE